MVYPQATGYRLKSRCLLPFLQCEVKLGVVWNELTTKPEPCVLQVFAIVATVSG